MRFPSPRLLARVCAVIALLALRALPAWADQPRLDPNVSPTFEAVALSIDPDQEAYTGSVQIDVHVAKATKDFLFHAEEMKLDSVVFTGANGAIPLTVADGGDRGTRRATSATQIAPGDYTLAIKFSKPYNTRAVGLYRVLHDGHAYLFTQFEDMDARKAFPCWDEPCFKIPYQLTLTIPMQQDAISNTPVEKETVGATTRTLQFKKTPPLPSYLIAIAAGPIESVAITGLPFPAHVYTPKGQKDLGRYAASITPQIIKALEDYFGIPYPFEKLDLIAVPEFWPGAMENAGAVTFRDHILLLDPKTTSTEHQQRLGYIEAHELAHMWFGDYVTMAWWDDLWLNESFADWLSEKIARKLYPNSDAETEDLQEVNATMNRDANVSTSPVRREIKTDADVMQDAGLAYEKGRTILRMTEAFIGEDAFQRGVRQYLAAHARKNAVAADLFSALSAAAGKDLEPMLASYLDQPGFPLIRVETGKGGVITLSQKRFLNYGAKAADATWTVPVRLKISDGKSVHTQVVLLDKPEKRVEVGSKVDWVMPNEGGLSYYRWIVPLDMMRKIASDPAHTLSKPERVAFLGNVRALLDGGEITGSEYLAVAASFANTPEPEVVSALLADLSSLRTPFVTDDLTEPFANYVRRALGPAKERYGIAPRPDDPETVAALRPGLIRMLGMEGRDPEVIAYCKKAANEYLADPKSVDASIASAVLGVAMMDGTQEEYDDLRARYEKATNPVEKSRYLGAMGHFEDPDIQDQLLAYALTDKVRPTDLMQVIGGVARTDEGRQKVWTWMTKNYTRLASRVPPEFVSYYPYMAGGCDQQRLAAAEKFFSEPEHSVDGTAATLSKVSNQVGDCLNLREREGKAVAAYLRDLPSAP